MTDIYVGEKLATKMETFFMGEDYVWFRFTFKDGSTTETLPLKGSY